MISYCCLATRSMTNLIKVVKNSSDILLLYFLGCSINVYDLIHLYRMTPYRCLATGNMTGLIEVVRNSSNIYDIQHKAGIMSTLQLKSGVIHQWIKEKCKGSQ